MNNRISISEWIDKYNNNEFNTYNIKKQIEAGWYDWFCKNNTLKSKTIKMGKIINKLKAGGKVKLTDWYVWFKNNCPLNGLLYDDFRFARLDSGDVMFIVQMDCCWNEFRFSVYGRTPDGEGHWDEPLFQCNSVKELVNWLNSPWEN